MSAADIVSCRGALPGVAHTIRRTERYEEITDEDCRRVASNPTLAKIGVPAFLAEFKPYLTAPSRQARSAFPVKGGRSSSSSSMRGFRLHRRGIPNDLL